MAHHLLSLCFLRTAGSWAPPMYLWVLGPIYLFYIHRHGRCYLRMSYLFKAKMVATGSLGPGSLGPGRGVGSCVGGRLEPGRDFPPPINENTGQRQEGKPLAKQVNSEEGTEINPWSKFSQTDRANLHTHMATVTWHFSFTVGTHWGTNSQFKAI